MDERAKQVSVRKQRKNYLPDILEKQGGKAKRGWKQLDRGWPRGPQGSRGKAGHPFQWKSSSNEF